MLTCIKERQVVRISVIADGKAQTVVHGIHQVAFFDRKDLVERAIGMVANALLTLKQLTRTNLLLRQPSLVGKAELQFVAIGRCLP